MARLARRKAAAMTREQRAEMARKMNKARWDKVRAEAEIRKRMLYNYAASCTVELLGMEPKTPFIGPRRKRKTTPPAYKVKGAK